MSSQLENISRGTLGMIFLILVCYLLSNNKRAINWKLVGMGIFAQLMFAMGVLNTKIAGQPVFWVFFGIILSYIIISRIVRVQKSNTLIASDALNIVLALAWQCIFFFGLIRSSTFANPGLAVLLSMIVLAFIIKWLASRSIEILKWSVLCSLAILTISIYTKVCNPGIFKVILENISYAFVELINLSHKGTEFLFGSLASDKQSWGYIFAVQVLPNIIFFAALSSILYYLGILQKIVYVFAYLLNKMNISGAESLSTAANIFLGQTEAPLMMGYSLQAQTQSGRIMRLALAVPVFAVLILGLMKLQIPLITNTMMVMVALSIYASPVLVFLALRGRGKSPETQNSTVERPKRGESLGELMSMLNDEDVDDLRTRVKLRLEEQIDSADAAEMETFADLLGEAKEKRR